MPPPDPIDALLAQYKATVGRLAAERSLPLAEACIAILAELLDARALPPSYRETLHVELARRLLDRVRIAGTRVDVDRDVAQAERLIQEGSGGLQPPAEVLVELGEGLRQRFAITHNPDHALRAIDYLGRGVIRLTVTRPDRPAWILSFLDVHRELWALTQDSADLDRTINAHRWVLTLDGLVPEVRSWFLNRHAARLHDRYQHAHDPNDLDEAVEAQRAVLGLLDPNTQRPVQFAERLVIYLVDRAERAPDVSDLEAALAVLHGELKGRFSDPDQASLLSLRGLVERLLYVRTSDLVKLDDAVLDQEAALSINGLTVDMQLTCRMRATNARRDRYRELGDEADLDAAVAHADGAIVMLSPNDERACRALNSRALCFLTRYEQASTDEDLTRALDDWRAALDAGRQAPRSANDDLAIALNNLGDAMTRHVYGRSGDARDLNDAIVLLREALQCDPGPTELPRTLNTLGLALYYRFRDRGTGADLHEAALVQERAVALTPLGAVGLAVRLDNLASTLVTSASAHGEPGLVERALFLRRRACSLVGPGSHDRANMLINLAATHLEAYWANSDFHHLGEAEELIARLPLDQPAAWRASIRTNSAIVLQELYAIRGRPADLDEAIHRLTEALAESPNDAPMRAYILVNLAQAVGRRGVHSRSSAQVDAAISVLETLLDELPLSHRLRPHAEGALATSRWVRGTVTRRLPDVEAAVRLGQRAVSTLPSGTPEHLQATFHLGLFLRTRHELRDTDADLNQARDLFKAVATTTAMPMMAVRAAQVWGEWAEDRGSWPEAATAYVLGVEAVDRLFDRQLLRPYRETLLRQASGLVTRAAVALVEIGHTQQAAEVLEAGRTMLANTALETTRAKLQSLAAVGRADLLERYVEASARLAALEEPPKVGSGRAALQPVERLEEAQRDVDAVVTEIRLTPGFAGFPRVAFPGKDEIAGLSAPCVYIVPGLTRGAAICIGPHRAVAWRPLPHATEDALRTRWQSWREQARRWNRSATDVEWSAEVLALTRWLWDAAVGEVMSILGSESQAILVPCGGFVDLPLHAAWRPTHEMADGRRFVVEDVTIRYAPSLRAALSAEARAGNAAPSLLAVLDESLANAASEVEGIATLFDPAEVRSVTRRQTTHAELLVMLSGSSVLHFACHGLADANNALNGAIYACSDTPLTLRDVFRNPLPAARLVVLSACESAVGDQSLRDEVINLPSGLLQAGAAGAIGSLWPVDDRATSALMQRFYQLWRLQGVPPALALRSAQLWMRDPVRGRAIDEDLADGVIDASVDTTHPVYWAPFVYVGA